MSSNGNGLGGGQIRVAHHDRTEVQVRPFEGFAPEEISLRDPLGLKSEGGATPRLAKPYPWTEGGDMNCIGKFDEIDTTSRTEAKALCAGCPVISECLESAMDEEVSQETGEPLSHHSRFLVRGGLTPRGRVELARKRAAGVEGDGLAV